jgi:hypothetical protein
METPLRAKNGCFAPLDSRGRLFLRDHSGGTGVLPGVVGGTVEAYRG